MVSSQAKQWEEAAALLRGAFVPDADFMTLQSLYRCWTKIKPHIQMPQVIRLAVLGGFTTTQLVQATELALFAMGGGVEVYEADYGVYRQEILDPSFEFVFVSHPQAVCLATTYRDLVRRPSISDSSDDVAKITENELADWTTLWKTAHDRLGCMILQNNFDRPIARQLDNHELRHPASLWNYIEE